MYFFFDIHPDSITLGIQLLKADDFETWFLSIQVLGESLYKVPVFTPRLMIHASLHDLGRGLCSHVPL